MPHLLYQKDDNRIPDNVIDENGNIVLNMCKVCCKVESQLSEPCITDSQHPTSVQILNGGFVIVPVELVLAAETFVRRCEAGEIKSNRTYMEFQRALIILYQLQEQES